MLWEEQNPRSLINLVTPAIRRKLEEARFEKPDLFDEPDEATLLKKLMDMTYRINATDNRIRVRFWMEYDYCHQWHTKGVDFNRVIAGIMTMENFQSRYLEVPGKVAWMLQPPTGYMVKANEALEYSLAQLRDVLESPHSLPGGRVDIKLAELKLKIAMWLDARVKGGIVQKTMNLHAHTDNPAVARAVTQGAMQPSMEQLNERLKALQAEQERLQNGGTLVLPPEALKKID